MNYDHKHPLLWSRKAQELSINPEKHIYQSDKQPSPPRDCISSMLSETKSKQSILSEIYFLATKPIITMA